MTGSVWPVLFGGAFAGITILSLGLLLVQWFRLPLHRSEARLLGFLLGAASLNLVVFATMALGIARPGVFAAIGIIVIGLCIWRSAWRYGVDVVLAPVPNVWRVLFAAGMLAFGVFTLMHAMAPEVSPDGTAYHLGTISRYLRQAGFGRYTTNMYANLPMGVEMLFAYAFAFGKNSAAALVHWQFYFLLPLMLLKFGRRFGFPTAGAVAGLLVFCSPVVGIDGSSAYVDVATGAVAFGMVYLLVIWERQRERGLLLAIGILAGFAYACKMTAFPALILAAGFIIWTSWRAREPWFRPAATVAIVAAALIVPWLAKNAVIVGNPFSPFLNKWFPNPYVRVSFEEEYRASFRDYYGRIKSPKEIPLEVTTGGAILNGFLGPIFLLAPLGLFALRWPLGRRLWIAALVLSVSYPNNIGTRFLLTPLPLVAFTMGMVLASWRMMAATVVVFHALSSWPGVARLYAHPYAWRLNDFRYKAAFRIEKEEGFLARFLPEYEMAKAVEKLVPPNGRVLTYSGLPEAYTSRDIVVVYQAGWNNELGDIIATGMSPDVQPTEGWSYRFAPREIRRVRVVQTEPSPNIWSVSEMRVFNREQEIPRDGTWRVRANPDPWDVQLAFDNCATTRWRAWESTKPGMYVEVDFGRRVTASEVRVDLAPGQGAPARLEVESAPGNWETLVQTPAVVSLPPVPHAQRYAADDLKRMGITHLMVSNSDFLANEMFLNRPAWGLTLIAETKLARLYRID